MVTFELGKKGERWNNQLKREWDKESSCVSDGNLIYDLPYTGWTL